jgi:arabinofuranosyltransferase
MTRSRSFQATILSLLFLVVLLRTAWLSDDALISLRSVLNFTHGFGLTFNIDERVQTFTHPLWLLFLTIAYSIVGHIYYATFALAMLTSIAVFWVVVRGAASTAQLWLAAGLLVFSRAFVDYSTSGLENPLSNLLLFATLVLYTAPRPRDGRWLTWLCVVASLLYLTRPDDVLLIAPLLVAATLEVQRVGPVLRAVAIGATPALLWTVFSVIYYGFPFPNTAYAKLATGINLGERARQGFLYLVDSLDRDPLTLTTIGLACVLAAVERSRVAIAVAIGLVLHVLYIVSIGGDFMSGRFLVLPFVAAVVVVTRLVALEPRRWLPAYVVLGVVAFATPQWPLTSDSRVGGIDSKRGGIVDERAVYFPTRSLLRAERQTFNSPEWPSYDGAAHKIDVLDTCGLMGWAGMEWGPYTHLLDECALADPLLARLPSVWNESWRIGHFRRMIPHGYRESLQQDANLLADPGLRTFYDEIRAITRGPVWSAERFRRIGRVNRGVYAHLVNRPFYRFGGELVTLEALSHPKADGTPADAPGNQPIKIELAVTCEVRPGRRYLELSADSDDVYRLSFVKNNAVVSSAQVGPVPEYRRKPGLVSYVVDVPNRARVSGFDTIVILPGGGDGTFAIGHLLLDGHPTTDAELQRRIGERR